MKSANTLLQYMQFRGYDTSSYPYGKGKIRALKVVMENDIPNVSKFGEVDGSPEELNDPGPLWLYN